MEEQILKMIQSHCDDQIHNDTAKEIATHIMKFIEWMNKNNYRKVGMDGVYWGIGRENTNYTTEQLYNHYLTKIKIIL